MSRILSRRSRSSRTRCSLNMRFAIDAQLPPASAHLLAAHGHRAEHVADMRCVDRSGFSRQRSFIFSNCSGGRGVPDSETRLIGESPMAGGGSGTPITHAADESETATAATCATRIEPQIGPCLRWRAITSSTEQFVRSRTSFRHLLQNRPLPETSISSQFIGHLNEKWFSVSFFMTHG